MGEGNQMVPVNTQADVARTEQSKPSPLSAWKQRQDEYLTSLDVSTDQGAKLYLTMTGPAKARALDCTMEPIVVCDFLAHEVDPMASDEGELGGSIRLVLITDKGLVIATRSQSFLDGWGRLLKVMELRKWTFPMRVKIDLVRKGKFPYLALGDAEPVKAAVVKVK
jgi:hypothetical protein